MNSLSCLKASLWSVVIVTGMTGSAFAGHGHGGGGHAGGGHGGGHHGGMGGGTMHHGGGTTHHHGGNYGGSYYGGGYSGLRFGIGGLGYGSGYGGYGGYGYGGSPYGYGSRYYSTPQYYTTPTYSYPSTVIINSTPSVPAPSYDNGPIVILAPAANDKPIEYTLNGQSFTMKPGQSQKFNHDRDWIVDFDRGDGKSSAQYGLKAATYKFKMTDKGWELFEAATPEPPTAAAQGEEPKPIDLVKPVEKTVPQKGTDEAPAPAKAEGDGK